MKYVDIRDLPPCSFSPQCLRLLDDLDAPTGARETTRLTYIEDLQEERKQRQLRSHVLDCPTCTALLAEARRTRMQQRTMLHHFLLSNEHRAPDTTRSVLEVLREKRQQEAERAKQTGPLQMNLVQSLPEKPDLPSLWLPTHQPTPVHRNFWQNVLTLTTVIAVLLAAFGLLNQASQQKVSQTSSTPSTPLPTATKTGFVEGNWRTVVFGLTVLTAAGASQSFMLSEFNADDEQEQTIMSTTQFSHVLLSQISQNGNYLLYSTRDASMQTVYWTMSATAEAHRYYEQSSTTAAAETLWLDTRYVLLMDKSGQVSKLDTQADVTQTPIQSWSLPAGSPVFYHAPYLYYTVADKIGTTLYRANLSQTQPVPLLVANNTASTRFWLSPDATTIFYTETSGIYAVSNDGTNNRLLYAGTGILPIGYAADNALVILQKTGGMFVVSKLGATADEPTQMLMNNAAPGASSLCDPSVIVVICDTDIALAPYGRGLLLHSYDADGTQHLLYDDLASGVSHLVKTLDANTNVQLPGWSTWQSRASKSTVTVGIPRASATNRCLCA